MKDNLTKIEKTGLDVEQDWMPHLLLPSYEEDTDKMRHLVLSRGLSHKLYGFYTSSISSFGYWLTFVLMSPLYCSELRLRSHTPARMPGTFCTSHQ
jgi:hypothetical protein